MPNLDYFIERGVRLLLNQQQAEGNFLSSSSPNPNSFQPAQTYPTTFFTSLILDALVEVPDPELQPLKEQASRYLLSEHSEAWSWNYWQRGSIIHKKLPYADDLDDTFCALAALFRYNPSLINGSAMARIVQLLTATEEKPGGPYRTWLVSGQADPVWHDIDVAVNANVAYFLSLQKISLPGLNSFIEDSIEQGLFYSPYYPSPYPPLYYIARFYQGNLQDSFQDYLWRLAEQTPKNSLEAALLATSLLRQGYYPAALLSYIQTHPWSISAFCQDPSQNGIAQFAGSTALTAAFCLEALALAIRMTSPLPQKPQSTLYTKLKNQALQEITSLDPILQTNCRQLTEKMLNRDLTQEILLMPYFFNQSLTLPSANPLLEEQLGLANLWGWLAYSIYDDFLDNEGVPALLPLANWALRQALTLFFHCPAPAEFFSQAQAILSRSETAQAWEVTNCRLPVTSKKISLHAFKALSQTQLTQLADRSMGHALGCIALAYTHNLQAELPCLELFFSHYLQAKQLHDDCHDWQDDLKKGRLTGVTSLLLENCSSFFLFSDLPKLQKLFWQESIVQLCQDIAQHCDEAEAALGQMSSLKENSPLNQLVESLRSSTRTTLAKRQDTLDFLAAYQTSKQP